MNKKLFLVATLTISVFFLLQLVSPALAGQYAYFDANGNQVSKSEYDRIAGEWNDYVESVNLKKEREKAERYRAMMEASQPAAPAASKNNALSTGAYQPSGAAYPTTSTGTTSYASSSNTALAPTSPRPDTKALMKPMQHFKGTSHYTPKMTVNTGGFK